jgi:hypothetical protein
MKHTALTFIFALAGFWGGCATLRESTYDRRWREGVIACYDVEALLPFLRQSIAAHPVFEDVTLSERKLESRWVFRSIESRWGGCGPVLVCGDWMFRTDDPHKGTFRFTLNYDYPQFVALVCQRISANEFRLERIEKNGWLMP